jgi:hypothetical protein
MAREQAETMDEGHWRAAENCERPAPGPQGFEGERSPETARK